jgi:undecaprenyl-diphosphatase
MKRSEQLRSVRLWAPQLGAGILLAVLFAWDRPVYQVIHGFRGPVLDELTRCISNLRGALFPILVGLSLVSWGALRSRTKVRRAGTALLLTVLLCGAVVSILKPTFARPGPGHAPAPKPAESWIETRYGRFPSSHAAVLFGSATALAAFLPATAPLGYGVALLVSYERLYRATHFPSDILAGAWIGVLAAKLVVALLVRRDGWRSDRAPLSLHRARNTTLRP